LLKGEIQDGQHLKVVRKGEILEFTAQDPSASSPNADTGVSS
jgi:hypothetical protein